ncbi:MAG: tetratricopeptide repeat protein, partial [Cyanobacteria bacterium]|nr:tetratricopeptide repeat protein [Cyanobacteriota bacterium]MDW8200287.1 tetratricopeptide repeat protein [Cyanobacteriota bacterium SKYGB_h_bin112]
MSTTAFPHDCQDIMKCSHLRSEHQSSTQSVAPVTNHESSALGYGCIPLTQIDQRSLQRQAKLAAQRGNYDHAIALLDVLITLDAGNASYYSNRGLLRFQAGYLEAAIQDYNMALQLNPRLASAYNNRGNYYAAQGQREKAIQDYDRAID